MIVPEVFGFVNGKCAERVRSEAEALGRGFGVQGKGAASPFIPCFLDGEEIHGLSSSGGGLRFLRMDSPRISMRWAL